MRDLGNQIWCISLHWGKSMRLEGRFNWVVWNQGQQCHFSDDDGRLPPRPVRDPQSERLHRHWARRGMSSCSHRLWGSLPGGRNTLWQKDPRLCKTGQSLHFYMSEFCRAIKGFKNIIWTKKISGVVTCVHCTAHTEIENSYKSRSHTFRRLIWSINRALGLPHACIMRAKISGGCRFRRFFFRTQNTAFCSLSFSSIVCCSTKSSHAYHTCKHRCISGFLFSKFVMLIFPRMQRSQSFQVSCL